MIKMLSKHFSYAEAVKSSTAMRLGIPNVPDEPTLTTMVWFANTIAERLRDLFGAFSPTSWFRCLKLNTAVGGSATSTHPKGNTIDFQIKGKKPIDVMKRIVASGIPFDQLIDEYDDWTHISSMQDASKNRGQVLEYRHSNGCTKCRAIDVSNWEKNAK